MAPSPERTCIGCRLVGAASGMVRLVAPDGSVRAIPRGRAAGPLGKLGRGAWVHPGCLGEAIKRGAMARAFRRQVGVVDAAVLLAQAQWVPGQSITVDKSR